MVMIIRCKHITGELISIARKLAEREKDVVTLIEPTATLEVYYEKVPQMSQSSSETSSHSNESKEPQKRIESR